VQGAMTRRGALVAEITELERRRDALLMAPPVAPAPVVPVMPLMPVAPTVARVPEPVAEPVAVAPLPAAVAPVPVAIAPTPMPVAPAPTPMAPPKKTARRLR